MKVLVFKILRWIALILLVAMAVILTFIEFILIAELEITLIFLILTITLIAIWGCIWFLKLLKKKIFWILFAIITVPIGAFILGDKLYDNYIDSIPVVSDQGVDLKEYEPFAENSKVAILEEPSTLQITDSLPVIDGATALYPLYTAFVQATYPSKEYLLNRSEVRCGTTPEAYNSLLSGKADVIFCAKPSNDQVRQTARKVKTFNMTSVGREAFVFFVNKDNPVKELTIQQIKDIYSGKIKNWKELGGKNDEIKAYQRPKNSGSQTMLEYIMGDTPPMPPLETEMAGGMGDIINYTADYKNYKNAIGYSFLFFATEMIKNNQIEVLKINGVYPSRETIRNSEYPLTGDFYAITTDTTNKNVQKLIEWILSPQGQFLVEKIGYVSVK